MKASSRISPQLLSLIAISMLAHVTMSGGRVTASLFALKQEGSEYLAGVAYSLYALLPALLSLHLGRWIDRVGPRSVLRGSMALMIAGLALPVVWPSIWAVFLMATFCGLGFGTYMLAANVSVGLMPFERENERVGMFGWLQMGNSVSAVVAPSLCGVMIDHFGFRAAFALLAVVVGASLTLSYKVQLPDQKGSVPDPKAVGESIVRTVLRDSRLLRIYLVGMTISLAWDGFVFMAPVLGHARGYSATTIGMVLSAFACGTFAVRALLPWLSRQMSEWRMLSVSFAMAAGVFLLLPWISSGLLYALLGFMFGLAVGAGQPNILNLVYRTMPKGRAGEGIGLRSMMGNMMGLTGPTLFGTISGLFGVVPVFLLIGCVMSASSWQARRGYQQSMAAS